MSKRRLIIQNEQKEDQAGIGGDSSNKVSYDLVDNKTPTEKNQARVNLGLISSSDVQVVTDGSPANPIHNLAVTSPTVFLISTGIWNVTGVVPLFDGQEILFISTAGTITFKSTVDSTDVNRFLGEGRIHQYESIRLKYRTALNRWIICQQTRDLGRLVVSATKINSGTLNNFILAPKENVLVFNNLVTLTGIEPDFPFLMEIIIYNGRAGTLTLSGEDALSLEANRFSETTVIPSGKWVKVIYILNRWRVAM